MAGRIAGITIEIGGDTSNLQKSLKGVDSQLRKTQSNLKDVNKLLKLDPGNTELLTQKQKNLESAISSTKSRLQELKAAQAGVAQGSEEWDALQREIIATEQSLNGLEEEYRNFGSVAAQQVAAAGAKLEEVGGKIEGVGQKLAPLSTAATAALGGLVTLAYNAITAADDLNTLAKQTGLTTEEIQKMKYAADLIDVPFETISKALTKMKSKMDPTNKTFQQLGVSVTNADGSMRGANEVFYEVVQALSQIENETERDQLAMELFGKSADELAGIIDDGGEALAEYGAQAEELGLILDQETLDSLNTLNDTVDQLKARFTGAFAKAGATLALKFGPALEKVAAKAQVLADKIANLSPETAELIVKVLGIAAAIAPLTIGIGKVVGGVGKVMGFAPKLVGIIGKVGALLGPHALLIAGIAAAVAAVGVLVYKNWDAIKAKTEEVWGKIKTELPKIWNGIKQIASKVWGSMSDFWQKHADKVKGIFSNIGSIVKNVFEGIKAFWAEWGDTIMTYATGVWDTLVGIFETGLTLVSDLIQVFADVFNGDWEAAWEDTKTLATNLWAGITSVLTTVWETIKSVASDIFEAVKEKVSEVWDNIKSAAETKWEEIKSAVSEKWESIKSDITTKLNNIKSTITSKWNAIKSAIQTRLTLIVSSVTSKWESIKSTIQTKIDDAKEAVSTAVDNIKSFFDFTLSLPDIQLPSWESIKADLDVIIANIKSLFDWDWKLPDIKLPHFKIEGGVAPYGLGGRGSLPTFSIDWYKRAYENPVMFTSPTVIGTPSGMKGFGDGHGAEIVMGLNKLRELVGSSGGTVINVYPPAGSNVQEIAAAVEQRLVAAQKRSMRVYA